MKFGHLICGITLGFKPKSFQIMPLGVCIEFNILHEDYNKKIKNGNILNIKKVILALAGPFTNMLVIILSIIFKEIISQSIFINIVYSNLLIALFNLLPIYPLDGGKVLKNILHIVKGRKRAVRNYEFCFKYDCNIYNNVI